MKIQKILAENIENLTPEMHKVRRKALIAVVSSLVEGANLSVTSLGRNITNETSEKHQIKRSVRLCSNPHLQIETFAIYRELTHDFVGHQNTLQYLLIGLI